MTLTRRVRAVAAATAVAIIALAGGAVLSPASAGPSSPSVAEIQGSGSSWAANAINQWIADVTQQGLKVVYTADGSAQGRQDFALKTVDFADSDIGYQGRDPLTGAVDTSLGRHFAYIPVVAGGTSFPYHIVVGGQLVRNLRLSGLTLAKIFTNKITNWHNPEITKDNNGHALPSLPIIPVVHSEGAGDTAQFSEYLTTVYPTYWRAFAGASAFTEYWPRQGNQVAQDGSSGLINYITSAAANGAIGYDEYSYALGANYPVAKIENTAGYFTLPTQYNVAVALTQAKINYDRSSPNYLLQTLNKVYVYKDPRAYALSSYSYGIVPTSGSDPHETTAKRQAMADFFDYSVCQGQAEIGPIGYSSLPINLVEAAFKQIQKLHTADRRVVVSQNSVSRCHNPTFIAGQPDKNYLAEIAPYPPKCDEAGHGPCTTANTGTGPKTGGGGGRSGKNGGGKSGKSGKTGKAGGSSTGPGTPTPSRHPSVNPTTGATEPAAPSSISPSDAAQGAVYADPQTVAAGQGGGLSGVLVALAALLVLAVVLLPPYLARFWRRHSAGGG
jgi:ABC-type phosphate transport system substrate-binding protein